MTKAKVSADNSFFWANGNENLHRFFVVVSKGLMGMKSKLFLLGSLALGLSSGFGLVNFSSEVHAAGFDDPLNSPIYSGATESGNSYLENSQPEGASNYTTDFQPRDQRSSEPILTWRNWSDPYAQGEATCRENNSNTVCLSPASARYMRW